MLERGLSVTWKHSFFMVLTHGWSSFLVFLLCFDNRPTYKSAGVVLIFYRLRTNVIQTLYNCCIDPQIHHMYSILILVSDFAIFRHTLTLAVCWQLYAHRVITRPGWMSNNAPLNGGERVGHWALLSETPVSFRGQLKRAQKSDSVLREDKVHSRHLSNLQALRIKGRLLLLY